MCFVLFLFCEDHLKYAVNLFRPGCNSEQVAAGILGYTQVSWDNGSGKEQQPVSADKAWAALTQHERSAAMVLGLRTNVTSCVYPTEPQLPLPSFIKLSELNRRQSFAARSVAM